MGYDPGCQQLSNLAEHPGRDEQMRSLQSCHELTSKLFIEEHAGDFVRVGEVPVEAPYCYFTGLISACYRGKESLFARMGRLFDPVSCDQFLSQSFKFLLPLGPGFSLL